MKGKDIMSAALGSAFFAVPQVVLATSMIPAVVIGAAAFTSSELLFSSFKPKETLKTTNITLYDKLTKAKKENKQIINLIPKIDSMEIKECLNHIHDTVDKIIKEIEKNPRKEKNIKNFFDYYLPVLVKITVRYDEIENQRLVSSEGKSFMKKADLMIKNTKDAFDTILASLYQKDIMDADAEMKIYDMMMSADGITQGDSIMKGVKNEK